MNYKAVQIEHIADYILIAGAIILLNLVTSNVPERLKKWIRGRETENE